MSVCVWLADTKDILVMLSDMDINAIAGTLKLYFRELPEPLLTDRLYPAFMEGIGATFELLHSFQEVCVFRLLPKWVTVDQLEKMRTVRKPSCHNWIWHLLPSSLTALSDPAAKENCMMHLLRSLPDPNIMTFLTLLEHLKRYTDTQIHTLFVIL